MKAISKENYSAISDGEEQYFSFDRVKFTIKGDFYNAIVEEILQDMMKRVTLNINDSSDGNLYFEVSFENLETLKYSFEELFTEAELGAISVSHRAKLIDLFDKASALLKALGDKEI